MTKTYIAVNEVHARPDLTKPLEIIAAGGALRCSADYAKDLLAMGAIRVPTADEAKILGIGDESDDAAEKAAAKAKSDADKADAKAKADAEKAAAKAKADAEKADAKAKADAAKAAVQKPADKPADASGDDGDDGTSMV